MANKPKTFAPSFLRSTLSGSRVMKMTFSDVQDTNIESTSSFIYDPPRSPLKSTQQLNVDWSRFENHTFFMSAEAKVNLAFEQIVNGYPFDGTKAEVEKFFEDLTGFDNWVLEQFPKFRGQLHFSGTQVGEDTDGTLGTFITTKDHAGALFPELAKNPSGESVLTPNDGKSMTIEMQIMVPSEPTSGNQIVLQKTSGSTQGFSIYLEPTGSVENAEVKFSVFSGSTNMTTSTEIRKGAFEHIAVTLNRELGVDYLQFYKNGEIVDTSRNKYAINNMSLDASDFVIASGSSMSIGSTIVTPTQTFSGTLDELRLWHEARTTKQLQEYSRKAVYTTEDLKLYYKFNEPSPPLVNDENSSVNAIVLDSSGNSLHSTITNFTGTLRQDAKQDSKSRMIYEKDQTSPVLFTSHEDVVDLNSTLLQSASVYDLANPNLITKLIPRHYLEEGQALEGFSSIEGDGGNAYGGDGIPGQGEKGSVQLLLSFLYIYARFFDEIKLFVDAFRNLRYVDYDSSETIPDNFLLDLVDQFGFNLPPLFNDSTIDQYVHAENIDPDFSTSELPLRYVQNELLRRTLINMPDVLKSKGTQHSIKSFLRAIGIDPDNSLRIREFGGPTTRQLSYARESKREPGMMLEHITSSYVTTPFLSASRTEPGYPEIAGQFVDKETYNPHGISDDPNDGLLTSGSWTVESIVKWTPMHIDIMTSATQSIGRMMLTGSNDSEGGIVANFLAVSSSIDPKLALWVRSGISNDSPTHFLELPLSSENNVFNGERWNVTFGVERNDSVNSRVSSSYFIRAATQSEGKIEVYRSTSSFFYEVTGNGEENAFRALDSTYNPSGSYFAVGEGQEILSGSSGGGTFLYLNDTSKVDSEARVTAFTGLQSNLRFWSKALNETEWKEHVRNFKSRGVDDPLTNFNFVTTNSGSFEKLRLETFVKQEERQAEQTGSVGELVFLDFSQNNLHATGSGFGLGVDILRGELFDYSYLSPVFDEASTNEKIRSRGYQNYELIKEEPWAQIAPVYEIVKSEEPTDDNRFVIEFSLVDALNRDIVTIFSTFDAIENALGNPELMFSPDYPDLERLRDVYFNRISDKLNFKSFFEFFRWFDMTIGTFIEQLVPRKTNFKGTNFVVESHMLERHKLEYKFNEIYLGEADRDRINSSIFLQQFTGNISKY